MQTDGALPSVSARVSAAAPAHGARWSVPQTLNLGGLALPVRETVIISVAALVLLLEWYHSFVPVLDPLLARGIDRFLLYGIVPLATLLVLRERPGDYGLRIGDWRVGVVGAVAAMAVATPVVLWAAGWPDVNAYYRQEAVDPLHLALASTLDVGTAEFLFRGFLLMALVRWCGPLGVVLAGVPFVFVHLSKPELEALSTVVTGIGFGWLAWRTGSVLYGAVLHVYILTLVMVAASW
jgi:membrane protease YdiL (CAAX protease family)